LLVASPFLIFTFLRKRKELFWISISLTGSTLLIFFITQMFFYTTMRYMLDLVPALTLLALIGLWSRLNPPKIKKPFTVLAATLWAYTIFIGVVFPLSSNLNSLPITGDP
jgi:predicted membrane-bound mannosyltransferase